MKPLKSVATYIAIAVACITATMACAQEPIVFPTPLPTATPFVLPSPLPTATPAPTATPVVIPSPLPTATPFSILFPTPVATATPFVLPSPLPTATPAPTATPVVFPTPLPTATPVRVQIPPVLPSPTPVTFPTPLPTATPAPTATPQPVVDTGAVPFAGIEEMARRGIVAIYQQTSDNFKRGTAWAFYSSFYEGNLLVTAHHNLFDKSLRAREPLILSTGEREEGTQLTLWLESPRFDLAGLWPRIGWKSDYLKPWKIAPADREVEVGEEVMLVAYAINQWGGDVLLTPYLKKGVVSLVDETLHPPLIMTDIDVAEGMSGGVLVNSRLEVVGMVLETNIDPRFQGRTYALHFKAIRESIRTHLRGQ